ncbi:hypothetical protein B0H16DRAFT_1512150 [Mycena metata]|uniref:ABC transporter domain-containing protein n=1 Tax=Mycena metata TaxID=1033252 RepID=A0AAD7NSI5_9AGAR|nr:hypothetical protein B0H16DRAFT_1512150 [Mycena metata]
MSSFSSGHRHPSLLPSPSTTNKLRRRPVMNSKQPLLPSTVPFYPIPSEDKDDNRHPFNASRGVKRLSWGMFQVAYEPPVCRFSFDALRQTLRDLRQSTPCATRLLLEICQTARTPFAVHILAAALLVIAPAFSLYLSAAVLGVVEQSVGLRRMSDENVSMLQVLVVVWLFVAIMSTLANRIMADTAFALKGHLRAHFLPQLVKASLRLDPTALTSRKAMRSLPEEYGFEIEVPGFRFFHEIVTRLRNFLTVVGEVGVLVAIISRRGAHETQLLAFFALMLPAVMLLKPSSGFGGAGFVFWTPNRNFYYLAALYKIAFSRDFRPTLARDGLCAYISEEYERISAELGYQNVETLGLQPPIPVQWYWDLIHTLMVDYPLAVCALILPWAAPLASLVSMVLVQHATTTLKQSIEQLRWAQSPDTLVEVLQGAEELYETIAFDSELNRGTIAYPDPRSKEKGMKIVFRNVSFRHDQEEHVAFAGKEPLLPISGVNFEIPAGSLAVVVGGDHSGKTSLLSLIPRVQEPSAGEILIDDKPLLAYDVDSVRGAMACISQREEMYPLTLRDNLLMGAGRDAKRNEEILQTAARLGCSADFIDGLPAKYDTILDPAAATMQSIQGELHADVCG